jgi:hypothetical protein
MGKIANTVRKASKSQPARRIVRRAVAVRGNDGRLTPGDETVARVHLVIQDVKSATLVRDLHGDKSKGDIHVWTERSCLAAAYDDGDDDKVALGWTSLNIAPPEGADGPPGDHIEWRGRMFEVTAMQDWTEDGLIPDAAIQRYVAYDRGAA